MGGCKKRFSFMFVLALMLAWPGGASANEPARDSGGAISPEKHFFAIETVSANLSGPLGGRTAAYTVTAGLTPILDEEGTEKAEIFSTAYTIKPARGEKRPVAFIFNGGPGASSIFLHMGGLGPKTVPAAPKGGLGEPAHPYRVADNPYSPLAVADLVFVDPVGTGFSRSLGRKEEDQAGISPLAPSDPKANAAFWNTERDLETLAQFIRIWLTGNNRWGSRVFIIGESYGGFRAAGLPFFLSKIGVATSGTVMVSPVVNYKYILQTDMEFEADLSILPTAAAIARYHGLLAKDLQEQTEQELADRVWQWARTEYRQALMEGGLLSEERFQAVARELSRLTSLPEREFIGRGLRFPVSQFASLVLMERRLMVSPYDGRMTGPLPIFAAAEEDPLNRVVNEYYYTALMDFLRGAVGVETLRPYLALSDAVIANWRFLDDNDVPAMPGTAYALATQMRRFPSLKVFLALGRYDLVCPPESALAALEAMDIPKDRLANIETRMYDGGHMMYTNPEAARRLGEDLSAWMTAVMNDPPGAP